MAVAAELEGQPAYLVVTHYPHADADQALFEKENRTKLKDARKVHEASHPRWKDALVLWAADRNMVTDKCRDRQTPKPDHTKAIEEMSETRASMALVDVWTAIRPWSDPGYTLGVPGDRKRYDTWDSTARWLGGHTGVVSIRVVQREELGVPGREITKRKAARRRSRITTRL